jgi:hypothetical protein
MLLLMENLPALLFVLLGLALFYLGNILWLRPEKIRKRLRRQGVKGPRPTLLDGNTREMKRIRHELKPMKKQDSNNYISTLFPHLLIWMETYGMYASVS